MSERGKVMRLFKLEWLAIAAAAGILVYLLFLEPLIGLADSGDFLRIAGTVGLKGLDPLASYEEQFFGYFHSQYQYADMGLGGYLSTQIIIVLAAVLLGKIFDPQIFDIRFLAAIYCALLLIAYYLFLQLKLLTSSAAKLALAIVFLLVFLDVGYAVYFNSLYGEPLSLVFLLLTIALALRMLEGDLNRKRYLIAFFIAALFLVGSKVQNAPVGLILCVLSLRFLQVGQRNWKNLIFGFTALLLVVSVFIYATAPKELRVINQYQAVFYGILKDSPHPEKDLIDLGLDPKLVVLAGTNYFTSDTPIPQKSEELKELFYNHISHGKIAIFYLTHPDRYIGKLEVTAKNTLNMRPSYLGNYEKAAGVERGTISTTYDTWSQFKTKALPHSLWFLIPFFILYYLFMIRSYRNEANTDRKKAHEVLMSVGLMAIISFVVPLLGDGEADMEKHLFLFNVCLDLMFSISMIWLVHQAVNWMKVRAT
jgi:hypothetical protein